MTTTKTEGHPLEKLLKGKPEQWPDTIAASIEEVERAIDAAKVQIDTLREQRRQLKALQDAVSPAEAKPKQAKAKPAAAGTVGRGSGQDKRLKAHDIISRKGPQKPKDLAAELGCTSGNVWQLMQHEWFTKLDDGRYDIATTE